MSSNDRTILLVIPVIVAVVAFWFLALSPKQDKAKKLDAQITKLQGEVAASQQAAQEGQQAREQFPRDYHRLVVMGKAVPVDDETASLLVQLNRIAGHSGADFRAIKLSSSSSSDTSSTATAAPPTTPAPSDSSAAPTSDTSSSSTAASTTTALPTESVAAALPIGATVGSAGLPTLPYELTFRGTYSQIADFMTGVDRLVDPRKGRIAADGRLMTIDGFTLTADDTAPYPVLQATLNVTTYVTPAGEGLTAGATPTDPTGLTVTGAAQTATQAASTTSSTPASAPATP
jgi:Tfp pilus assembly protein PilO